MNNYQVFWFTGQAGAGKTELAKSLKSHLTANNEEKKCVILDGDDIREMFDNKDYSTEGRKKNVEFVQKLCIFLSKNNIIPIVCMVSPFLEQREELKKKVSVCEVYVHCSEIRGRENFHVDYYEKPQDSFFPIDTTGKSVEESFSILLKNL